MSEKSQIPTEIKLHKESGTLDLSYSVDGSEKKYQLTAEYLRVYSPSAEVRGHGPGEEVLQLGKEDVLIKSLQPVGHYAIKIEFDDGHDSGLYSWDWLYKLAVNEEQLWQEYLEKLRKAGYERKTFAERMQ